jgi:hypothetical protein
MSRTEAVPASEGGIVNVIDTIKRTGATLAVGGALVGAFAATAQAAGSSSSSAAAQQALQFRSEALNREYHLGSYAMPGSAGATRALELRGNALNQRYHLGDYAVIRPVSGFDWSDAGIGAASMLGLIAAAGGLFVVSRRHRAVGNRPLRQAG